MVVVTGQATVADAVAVMTGTAPGFVELFEVRPIRCGFLSVIGQVIRIDVDLVARRTASVTAITKVRPV